MVRMARSLCTKVPLQIRKTLSNNKSSAILNILDRRGEENTKQEPGHSFDGEPGKHLDAAPWRER